jgi:hypothetical protein
MDNDLMHFQNITFFFGGGEVKLFLSGFVAKINCWIKVIVSVTVIQYHSKTRIAVTAGSMMYAQHSFS